MGRNINYSVRLLLAVSIKAKLSPTEREPAEKVPKLSHRSRMMESKPAIYETGGRFRPTGQQLFGGSYQMQFRTRAFSCWFCLKWPYTVPNQSTVKQTANWTTDTCTNSSILGCFTLARRSSQCWIVLPRHHISIMCNGARRGRLQLVGQTCPLV